MGDFHLHNFGLPQQGYPMRYENRTFQDEHVPLDGNEFVRCSFVRCTLVYGGGKPPSLDGCSFVALRLAFIGPAGETIGFLQALYHGGFKPLVEHTIDNIRANKRDAIPPPDGDL